MKQLLLDINADIPQTLDTFVVGQHAEVMHILRMFKNRIPGPSGERAAYLWGAAGAGKSHLLHALCHDPEAYYICPETNASSIEYFPHKNLYLTDDCHNLNDAQQIAVFNLYNQVKENHAFFVASGTVPPVILNVRDDLRTRLGWSLIYQIHELTDEYKIAALESTASARGITIPSGVLPYLITHYQRDMLSLTNIVNSLIHFSLESNRPITLPLLREHMLRQKVEV